MDLNEKIRRVPDFPKKGIEFYDITTVLQDAEAFRETVDGMAEAIRQVPCDVIVGLESRGFLFAAPVAYALGKSLVLVRKQGKLPYKTISASYDLEYGSDCFEVHEDAIQKGQNVVIVDDLLATGGTSEATADLVNRLGGVVTAMVYFIELEELKGREKLSCPVVTSLVKL